MWRAVMSSNYKYMVNKFKEIYSYNIPRAKEKIKILQSHLIYKI